MYRSLHRFTPLVNSANGRPVTGAAAAAAATTTTAGGSVAGVPLPAATTLLSGTSTPWTRTAQQQQQQYRHLHATAHTCIRRKVDLGPGQPKNAKVNEEALFRHVRPPMDNSYGSNELKSAKRLVNELIGNQRSQKSVSKMMQAQSRKYKRDAELRKLTGNKPEHSAHAQTGAPTAGQRQAKESAREAHKTRKSPITDLPESNLPPPGVEMDKEDTKPSVKRRIMYPLVFGSRDRKVSRSYKRLIDRLRTKAGKLKTKHPLQAIHPGGMSSGGDLVSYCKRMEKLTAKNRNIHRWLEEARMSPDEREAKARIAKEQKSLEFKKKSKSKALAVPEKPQNNADVQLRRNVKLLKLAETMAAKPALKYAPTANEHDTEMYLKNEARLQFMSHELRHMPSDREGSERDIMARDCSPRSAVVGHERHRQTRFHDCVTISVKGGHGGDGRQKSRSVGGDGGNIYIEAVQGVSLDALANLPVRRFTSELGGNGDVSKLKGRRGNDMIISVPVGTVVTKLSGEAGGKMSSDLNHDSQKVLVAKGGTGGSVFTEPPWKGTLGQRQSLRLELKMLADVGLVGFPNAGKSTLLSRMSRSEPKIASYPFTTIRPQIGIVNYLAGERVSMADLPGLIEGAHMNIGLGHRFLRHLERCKVLLYMVDINGFQLSLHDEMRSPLENIEILAEELEMYKEGLSQRPAILCITKMDTPGAVEKCRELMVHLKNYMVDGATIPDLDAYKNFVEETPIHEGERMKFLPEEDHILQAPLLTAEGQLEEKPMVDIDAGEVLAHLGESSAPISEDGAIHVSDFPVPAHEMTGYHAGNPLLKDEVSAEARRIIDAPISPENVSRSTVLEQQRRSMSVGKIEAARDVRERAQRQREQLRGLAMGFEYEKSPLDQADERTFRNVSAQDLDVSPEGYTPLQDESIAEKEQVDDGAIDGRMDEEETSLMSLGESALATSASSRQRKAATNSLAVRRPKPTIRFQQVIPISCRRELQGLDFLYLTMRGVVKASKQMSGERVNFTQQLVRSESPELHGEELEEAQRFTQMAQRAEDAQK
ncbi:uncharacterized protein LOC135824135 [Sycon ciliatum]|uniref:uncharacterized protein LOC135824135 n=1 Tax=Sycon ciliatum TaxID=27933 RepID=UPI0031F68C5D